MTVTPFYFRIYICVQIFITTERIIKIFFLFWANGSLKVENLHKTTTRKLIKIAEILIEARSKRFSVTVKLNFLFALIFCNFFLFKHSLMNRKTNMWNYFLWQVINSFCMWKFVLHLCYLNWILDNKDATLLLWRLIQTNLTKWYAMLYT